LEENYLRYTNTTTAALRSAVLTFAALAAAAGVCSAQGNSQGQAPTSGTQNVNVVNTPSVSVSTLPAVTLSGTPTVNVATLPAVTLSGTPTVNANVTFPSSLGVTLTQPGPLTNVGRLPSQQFNLASIPYFISACTTHIGAFSADGSSLPCFDMTQHQGQVLIVTDVKWYATGTAGNACYVGLGFGNSFFLSVAHGGPDGVAAKSEHLTTGIKMTGTPAANSNCSGLALYAQGYLVTNQ
jgi:hypothetical protein